MVVTSKSGGIRTMCTIPTSVTEDQFNEHIRPYLSTAKRGYECKIPPRTPKVELI